MPNELRPVQVEFAPEFKRNRFSLLRQSYRRNSDVGLTVMYESGEPV